MPGYNRQKILRRSLRRIAKRRKSRRNLNGDREKETALLSLRSKERKSGRRATDSTREAAAYTVQIGKLPVNVCPGCGDPDCPNFLGR